MRAVRFTNIVAAVVLAVLLTGCPSSQPEFQFSLWGGDLRNAVCAGGYHGSIVIGETVVFDRVRVEPDFRVSAHEFQGVNEWFSVGTAVRVAIECLQVDGAVIGESVFEGALVRLSRVFIWVANRPAEEDDECVAPASGDSLICVTASGVKFEGAEVGRSSGFR